MTKKEDGAKCRAAGRPQGGGVGGILTKNKPGWKAWPPCGLPRDEAEIHVSARLSNALQRPLKRAAGRHTEEIRA